MKNLLTVFSLIISLLFITNCKKENKTPVDDKQYLFGGLPYYLTDTLYYYEGSWRKMLSAWDMQLDSKGFAWILSTGLNLFRYKPATEELIQWNSKEVLGINNPPWGIKSIFIDSKDRIWGASDGELYMFDGNSYSCFTLNDPQQLVRSMGEDAGGNIHFNGYTNGKEYICDGKSIVQSDPVFAPDKYHIYKIYSDDHRNIWYNIDLTPDVKSDRGMYVVKYSNANDYTMVKEFGNTIDALANVQCVVFDSNGTPFFNPSSIWHLTSNYEWEYAFKDNELSGLSRFYIDHENNIWGSFSKGPNGGPNMGILKDGKWITESPFIKTIKDRNNVVNISFPNKNTVWVCTSGGVFEFKK